MQNTNILTANLYKEIQNGTLFWMQGQNVLRQEAIEVIGSCWLYDEEIMRVRNNYSNFFLRRLSLFTWSLNTISD